MTVAAPFECPAGNAASRYKYLGLEAYHKQSPEKLRSRCLLRSGHQELPIPILRVA